MANYNRKDDAASYSEAAEILDSMTAQDVSRACQIKYSLHGFCVYKVINSEGKMLERDDLDVADELAMHVCGHLTRANPLEEHVSVSPDESGRFLIKCKKRNLAMLLTIESQSQIKTRAN